jgi:hypothetical protein
MALQRSGHSAAMMLAVRAPQSEDRRFDPESIHQSDDVERDRRLLAVPEGVG